MRRTTVTVVAERVDEALDVLLPALPGGVYERPAGEVVELAWLGDLPGGVDLGDLVRERWEDEVAGDPGERAAARAPGRVIGGRILVRAPAHPPATGGLIDVVIVGTSGAFGTGTHPTTRHCLEFLLDIPAQPGGFADLGCGAGVLAIAAAKLGHEPVIAIDIEARSARSTHENAERNGVEVAAMQLDLMQTAPPPARCIAANVPESVHEQLIANLSPDVETVLVSGIVEEQEPAIARLYEGLGFVARGRRSDSGWVTIHFDRDAGW